MKINTKKWQLQLSQLCQSLLHSFSRIITRINQYVTSTVVTTTTTATYNDGDVTRAVRYDC